MIMDLPIVERPVPFAEEIRSERKERLRHLRRRILAFRARSQRRKERRRQYGESVSDKRKYLAKRLPESRTTLRFEVNVTYRCNAICRWCNRLVGVISPPDSDVTPDQVVRMKEVLKKEKVFPWRIKVAGGEPAVNPHLPKIMEQLDPAKDEPDGALQLLRTGWVLTNALPDEEKNRREIPIPEPYRWHRSPLNATYGKKKHDPFLVSPWDLGISDTRPMTVPCKTMSTCGRAFEAWGFTMCGIAGSIARLLRLNPYKKTPVSVRDYDICKHCIYSLPDNMQDHLYELARQKKVPHPSPTFREGLKRWREEGPVEYERF